MTGIADRRALGRRLFLCLGILSLPSLGAAEEQPVPPVSRVPVRLLVDRPIDLFEHPRDGEEYPILTHAANPSGSPPIELWLSRQRGYRVKGPGIAREDFEIPEGGPLEMRIRTGRRAINIAGAVVGTVGIVMVAAGLWTTVAGVFTSSTAEVGPPGWLPAQTRVYAAAGTLLSVGAVAVICGWVAYSVESTRIDITPIPLSATRKLPGGLRLSMRGVEF